MTPNNSQLTKAEHDYHADPDNEAAARNLISAYQHVGRRDDAIRVGFRLLLHLDTLNRLPEPETQRLMQNLAVVPHPLPLRRTVSRRNAVAAFAVLGLCGLGAFTSRLQSTDPEFHKRQGDKNATQAALLYDKGEYDEAYANAQAAHDHYVLCGNTALAADGGNSLVMGKIFQAWGKFEIAHDWVAAGASKIHQSGSPLGAAYALNTAANLNIKLGNFAQAYKQNEQSFEIRRDARDDAGIIECLRERGTILAAQDDARAAETAWQDAERQAYKAKKPDMIASLQFLRGSDAIQQGKSDNGALESSFRFWQKNGHLKWQADVRLRQAEGDLVAQQLASAQNRLNFCRNIYTTTKSQIGLADCNMVEGLIALENGKTKQAENSLNQAVAFYWEAGLTPRIHHAEKLAALIREK